MKQAQVLLRKAIEIKPDFAEAYYNLGNILKDLENLKQAQVLLRKAIEIKPDFAEAYYNLGNILKDLENLKQAQVLLRKAIEIKPDFAEAYYNLGNILKDLGNLKQAQVLLRKAIEIKPDFAEAYYNLGNILKDLGNLKQAQVLLRKAIEIKPDFTEANYNLGNILCEIGNFKEAELLLLQSIKNKYNFTQSYFALSILQSSSKEKEWHKKLFSENILVNQSTKNHIDIYFARANIMHKQKNFQESSKYLELANKLKLKLNPSNSKSFIEKSRTLLIETDKQNVQYPENKKKLESIFIVGMPRSGSTLLESILSMNTNVNALGEINILEKAFLKLQTFKKELTLAEEYWKKISKLKVESNITTNKNLYNYQYTGLIVKKIPDSKIIHCFRHPLDNILSIYRAHFGKGNEYSSSIADCTKIYLDQEQIMTQYKNRFRSNIYDLSYEKLVSNPKYEIKSLISWLNWKWDDSYLSPHLNPRLVSTASNVEVRSPINSKSIGGWKNYKDILIPAIEIISKTKKYREFID